MQGQWHSPSRTNSVTKEGRALPFPSDELDSRNIWARDIRMLARRTLKFERSTARRYPFQDIENPQA
jgi:hypothetical protein